jgi:uncharacterized membrane protein
MTQPTEGRERFLSDLRAALHRHGVDGADEIISDYRSHITEAVARGQTEDDVLRRLGSPEVLARAFDARQMVSPSQVHWSRVLKAAGRLLAVAPAQLLFGIFPAAAALSLVLILGSVAVGTAGAGVGIWAAAPSVAAAGLGGLGWLGFVCLSIALLSLGVCFFAGFWIFGRGCLRFAARYIRWNLDWALDRRGGES